MNNVGASTSSLDGRRMLYTVSAMDWQEARRQTDIYLVSMRDGLKSTRQMTFTSEKNETSPAWTRDGNAFLFLSNREAPSNAATQNQIYLMRPDGGEARRLTNAKDGVTDFKMSPDGKWLIYRAGPTDNRQLFRLAMPVFPTDEPAAASANGSHPMFGEPESLTKQATGVDTWTLVAGTKPRIYFISPDRADADEKARRDKKFTVNVRNAETPTASLWALDLDPVRPSKLTTEGAYSVTAFTASDDGKWMGFHGGSTNRYERNITASNLYGDVYLLETATRQIERLSNNREVGESGVSFSPDGRWVAYSAPDDTTKYTMTNERVYIRAVGDRGKPFRKLVGGFDGDVTIGFWSKDGNTIYFNEGLKA